MRKHDFDERLAFSRRRAEATDLETIKAIIPGCTDVQDVTDLALQRLGIDYVAKLRRGAEVLIDAKARDRGCSEWWKNGEPELALEKWSVIPWNGKDGKAGWALDESKATDYTLHTFDPEDTEEVFLLPFQLLRAAFRTKLAEWEAAFKASIQDNGSWKSQCVFVPADVVLLAIENEMRRKAPGGLTD